jgi:hypothetical protein
VKNVPEAETPSHSTIGERPAAATNKFRNTNATPPRARFAFLLSVHYVCSSRQSLWHPSMHRKGKLKTDDAEKRLGSWIYKSRKSTLLL